MSKRYFSSHALNVFTLELEHWQYPMHSHNFFELIFVEKGNGLHRLNDEEFSYAKGDIFLLTPDDAHEFTIKERSTFRYVKFTEQLFAEKSSIDGNSIWQKKVEPALVRPNTIPGDIVTIDADRAKLFTLVELLGQEYHATCTFSRQSTLDLFGAMLTIVARNLTGKQKSKKAIKSIEQERVTEVLSYVRTHALDRDKVSLEALGATFNMSANYVGLYVKKHSGLSVREMVSQTRMKKAEQLLKRSRLTIAEIADSLNFTDSSHFSHAFKKHAGVTAGAFRER